MLRRRSGRIVNLSSQAGFVALPTESVYCMTKAAIAHLTKCLAVEWGPHGIRVNAVAPQIIATEKNRALFPPEMLAEAAEPDAIADVIAFLVSDAATTVSGAVVPTYG
jgi:NAD(P)-dependent dehydrogenase (short-subunit alcohol dehydrogenase family)